MGRKAKHSIVAGAMAFGDLSFVRRKGTLLGAHLIAKPRPLRRSKYFSKSVVACVLATLFVTSCSLIEAKSDEVTAEFFAMNTIMRIQAYGREAKEAVEAGKVEVYRLEKLLSRTLDGSEVSAINALSGAESIAVSEESYRLIETALYYCAATGGAFDITVAPVMDLWGFQSGDYRVPSSAEIDSVRTLLDYKKVRLIEDARSIFLEKKGMGLDLGAVVKGYAGDRVLSVIQQYDVDSALINLGGNVTVMGSKKTGDLYRVAIADPERANEYLGVVTVADKHIVTSGGYERFFESEGKIYIHIMDPKTACPVESDLLSVSVIDADGIRCDVLSTALFVMGKSEAIQFWQENPVYGLVLLEKSGALYVSINMKDCFSASEGREVVYF